MGKSATCHIVAAGPCEEGLGLQPAEGDFLIAADGGLLLCRRAGLVPDLFIGDFDSLPASELSAQPPFECIELPCAKDDTDTLAALREGLRRGWRVFEVHAALGGDVGHELANLQALLYARQQGAWAVLHGGGQTVALVCPADGLQAFATHPGMRVSVFAFAGEARGVVEHGLAWELDGATLTPAFPLGCSNKATGGQVRIGVAAGTLAVVLG